MPLIRRFFLIFIILIFLLGLAHEIVNPYLSWDRGALLQFQWWRLLTGHLVHNNFQHMIMNVSVFAFAAYLYGRCFSLLTWLLFFVALCLSNSLALFLLNSNLENYVGLSGVMYGILVLGLVKSFPASKMMNGLILIFITGKVIWEQLPGFDALYMHEQIGTAVIVDAHLYGFLCGGVLLAVYFLLLVLSDKKKADSNDVLPELTLSGDKESEN